MWPSQGSARFQIGQAHVLKLKYKFLAKGQGNSLCLAGTYKCPTYHKREMSVFFLSFSVVESDGGGDSGARSDLDEESKVRGLSFGQRLSWEWVCVADVLQNV